MTRNIFELSTKPVLTVYVIRNSKSNKDKLSLAK